jgi:hypothetical protein
MAFLFPNLFPGCIQEGGYNVSLSLENAMAMYWKAVALQLVASCVDDGVTYSLNILLTAEHTLDELICGTVARFSGLDQFGIKRTLDVGAGAYKQGELYIPYLYGQFVPSAGDGSGRGLIITTESYAGSSPISFQGQSFGGLFFNDDTGDILSGSGSLTIVAERTFD